MELSIAKYTGTGQKVETNHWPIQKYKVLTNSNALILVSESDMDVDGVSMVHHELFKVQFIASCRIEKFENPLIVAFYIGELGEFYSYIISGLPNNYYNTDTRFFIVDYSSYKNICSMTGETPLSFSEYLQFVKSDRVGINTYIEKEGQLLNHDEQIKFYEANAQQS